MDVDASAFARALHKTKRDFLAAAVPEGQPKAECREWQKARLELPRL